MINVKAQRDLERKAKFEAQEKEAREFMEACKAVCLSPQGKTFMKYINKFCGYHEDVFNPESQSSTTYNQGRQSVAIYINKTLEKENGYGSNISPHIKPPTDSNS